MNITGSPTVSRVLDGQLCTGCGLCASLSGGALSMGTDQAGFARPRGRAAVPGEAEVKIAQACPGAVVAPWEAADQLHPYWGPYRRLATGHVHDETVRFQASSGGVVTGLAVHALRSGLVDRVVHIMPDEQDPAANTVVCSTTPDQVVAGAGSRYVSSSPLADIDRLLVDGGAICFIGKPCDVSALRRLATVDPRVDRHVKLMLAFFCAGVPSRRAVSRLLKAMTVPDEELAAFRYRGNGWPGKATAIALDGRTAQMSYEDSWGGYLSKDLQFRCKICPDAVGGVADVACADAWYGGEAGYPAFEEQPGRSLIVSRTPAGDAVLEAAVAAGALEMEPLEVAEIDLMQPAQARRKRLVRSRMAALAVTFSPRPAMRGLQVDVASRRAGTRESFKNFVGALRRRLQRRN